MAMGGTGPIHHSEIGRGWMWCRCNVDQRGGGGDLFQEDGMRADSNFGITGEICPTIEESLTFLGTGARSAVDGRLAVGGRGRTPGVYP